jgi:two-component system, chemotaxis family, protein-glutamate methylesterase/glutaminase
VSSSRDLVVVGASAGGVEALQQFAAGLPADLPACVLVVLHVSPTSASVLPAILDRAGALQASHAEDGSMLEHGRIYVAPPNFHLLVDETQVRLDQSTPEHGHRPAVDPLFRSAARVFGERVVGVILSGALDDGALGLAAVKAGGGVTVAQDPEDAKYPSMPRNAIARAGADYVVAAGGLAELVARLVGVGESGELPTHEGGLRAS